MKRKRQKGQNKFNRQKRREKSYKDMIYKDSFLYLMWKIGAGEDPLARKMMAIFSYPVNCKGSILQPEDISSLVARMSQCL